MPYRAFDQVEARCPRMGHQINFGYCRAMDQGLPCSKAIDCFYYSFPVEAYFRRVLKEETFARIFLSQGPGRYESFLKTLSEAKDRVKDGGAPDGDDDQ
ncbi:hypothetical protein AAU61_03720 [Desulfocarbo indianensis]|nr:hypothetical protein AAU61_03720 [Desulfocarbo indianensis]